MPGIDAPSAGCAPTTTIAGFFSFRNVDTPMIVPVVPIAETKCVMRPSVSRHSSGPGAAVVRERIVGIRELVEDGAATLGAHLPGQVARALHPLRLGDQDQLGAVRGHRLAPLVRQVVRHDEDHPVALHRGHHRERDAGVADVASISVSPGAMSPRFSASTIIDSAGRSLTDPAGLLPSSFARIVFDVAPGRRVSRTSGVLPIVDSAWDAWSRKV